MKLCMAISGGADSTAMAVIFHILAPLLGCELFCVHVDHSLRAESAEDAAFTAELCARLDIPCKIIKIDVGALAKDHGCGIEEAGRIGRHAVLANELGQQGFDFILFAHHAGDLAEDIIMRLIRGAGWPALGGMRKREGFILRPLLGINPDRLRAFLNSINQSWREDSSNSSMAFRRNRVRHKILPLLEKENPAILKTMLNLHHMAELDERYWDSKIADSLNHSPWREESDNHNFKITLPCKLLAGLPAAARLRLYRKAFLHLKAKTPGKGQIRADAFFRLEQAMRNGVGGKLFQLPGNVSITLKRGSLCFSAPLKNMDTSGGDSVKGFEE